MDRWIWFTALLCIIFNPVLRAANDPPVLPNDFTNVSKQDRALIRDLKLLNYPPKAWKDPHPIDPCFYDVVIIGGGMAGLSAGAALFKEGIYNIKIFDQNSSGSEGPWVTFARMKTLRSAKEITGPALEIPHLTFHAWFEAQWGQDAWKQLDKIPNDVWMQYLIWYREVMQLPMENHWKLLTILPMEEGFELEFEKFGQKRFVKALKVVLATGRDGFGGVNIPDFVQGLPQNTYAHTIQKIDFKSLKNRRVAVIGVGASGFDAAAVALETGAKSVDMLMRRERLPCVNKFASLYYKSFSYGFYKLSDHSRWEFICAAFGAGIPPPVDALKRLQGYKNFKLLSNTKINRINLIGPKLLVETNRGKFPYDFIILGTGYNIDGLKQKELRHFIDEIALWEDQLPEEIIKCNPSLGRFPYLGPSFEFLPKIPGTAPYLKHLYCFNFGSTLSHGVLSSDIPGISIGARRLAEGIATDFFIQNSELYLQKLKEFEVPDFDQDQFFIPWGSCSSDRR